MICLTSKGHWLASAGPASRPTIARAIASFLMSLSPPFAGYLRLHKLPCPSEGSPGAAGGWKKSWIRCASLGVTLGTAASSATDEQDEVGKEALTLEGASVAPREHFPHRREVVGSGHRADPVALVVVLLHLAVLPDDHGGHGLAALDRGDVEALDAVRRSGQVEGPFQLVQHDLQPVAAGQQVRLQGQRRVLLGHAHQLALLAALGGVELDPAAPALAEPLRGERRLRRLLG